MTPKDLTHSNLPDVDVQQRRNRLIHLDTILELLEVHDSAPEDRRRALCFKHHTKQFTYRQSLYSQAISEGICWRSENKLQIERKYKSGSGIF